MRALIVDDQMLVREGLKRVLGGMGTDVSVVGASSIAEAFEEVADQTLDLILLDHKLAGMGGVTGMGALRTHYPETPIIILSGHHRGPDIFAAYRSGASGFISKTLNREAMLSAIRIVLSGEIYVPGDLIAAWEDNPVELDTSSAGSHQTNPLRSLTDREQDVLARLLEGLQNKEIARDLDIEEITVKLHLTSVYKKLGARNRVHAVRRAYDLGWVPESRAKVSV